LPVATKRRPDLAAAFESEKAMRAFRVALIAAAATALPGEGSVEKDVKKAIPKEPRTLPHESPPSGAEFRVANRCAQRATLTYPKVRAVVDVPTWRGAVEALGDVTVPCLDGRPLKVQLEATSDLPACEAWTDPFDCHSEAGGATVVIECDDTTSLKCAAREVHAQCAGWASMAGFCPARSSAIAGSFRGAYACGGGSYVSMADGPLDATTLCPLCQCDHGTSCIGAACDACGGSGVVSRSADAACVPASWASSYSSSTRPTAPPHASSSSSSHRSPTKRSDDDDDDGTFAPTPFGAASADASSTAAVLIALVAAAITAFAIRQAIVKRRKREALGGAQFVDIPSRPAAMPSVSLRNPLRSSGGYDQIGDQVEMSRV